MILMFIFKSLRRKERKFSFPKEFSRRTKICLEKWGNIILDKNEAEEKDETLYGDPILIIEYNVAGLTARNITPGIVAQGMSVNIKLLLLRVSLISFF